MFQTQSQLIEIRKRLAERASPEVKARLERLIPGAKAVGVTVPDLRTLSAEYHASHKGLPIEQAAELFDELCRGGCREEILFGIFLLAKYGKKLEQLPWKRIEPWIDALDNWETCDQLAANVTARIVAKDRSLVDALVAMTSSPNMWRRRFAAANGAALNQKGHKLPEETLRLCGPLLGDGERLVQKAVAWALREASQIDEALVYAFLTRERKRIHPRILTEASEKLSSEHRGSLLA